MDPVTGKVMIVDHLNEVLMHIYSLEEPWKTLKIVKERVGDVRLGQLYNSPTGTKCQESR